MTADDAPPTTSKSSAVRAEAADAFDQGSTLIGRTVTINRPRDELYAYFRDFAKLPTFMDPHPLGGEGPRRQDRRVGRRHHRGA